MLENSICIATEMTKKDIDTASKQLGRLIRVFIGVNIGLPKNEQIFCTSELRYGN